MTPKQVQSQTPTNADPSRPVDNISDTDDMEQDSDDYEDLSSDNYDDNESSDGELLGRLALAYDPTQLSGNDLPQNGHDYLKLVQEERGRYPSVTTARLGQQAKEPQQSQLSLPGHSIDTAAIASVNAGHPTKSYEGIGNSNKTSSTDLPYRDAMLTNFRELCRKMDDIRESSMSQTATSLKIDINCDEAEVQKLKAQEEHLKQIEKSECSVKSLMRMISLGYPPQVSNLIHRSQMDTHLALENLAQQCEATPNYSTIHADWIYSLMAALREPIEADIYSTLRRLAKICIMRKQLLDKKTRRRSTSEQDCVVVKSNKDEQCRPTTNSVGAVEEEEYRSCLVIIGIVRHHFGQLDLSP